jgi:hypothetical protein
MLISSGVKVHSNPNPEPIWGVGKSNSCVVVSASHNVALHDTSITVVFRAATMVFLACSLVYLQPALLLRK